jgi:hypothetical protein
MLFGLFAMFASSGPALWAWRKIVRMRRTPRSADSPPSA